MPLTGDFPWDPIIAHVCDIPSGGTYDPLEVAQAHAATIMFDHTAPKSKIGLSTEHVFTGLAILAATLLLAAGVWIGRDQGAITITRTVHVHQTMAQLLGKPDSTVDGAQVNAQLAGWRCDIYSSKRTLVCHQ